MKIKQSFKDIEKPEDINQEELSSYLMEIYGEEKFDINDPRYQSENREFRSNWNSFTYKRQVDRIISELGKLSELNDFEHLRKHYDRPISSGASRIAAEEEKTFAEYICFKLAKRREKVNFVKFNDEVKAATLSKCIGGAARNMQMIFFSMEQAEYYQKYNFISNIALEYIRDKKLVSAGNEPHAVNKLIHEVSIVYKLIPPIDNYVHYRDLASPAPINMQRYAEFYPFMDNLMDSRAGVYSLVSFLSSDFMSKFPKAEDLNMVESDLPIGEDTSSKSILIIKDLLSEMGIDKSYIIKEDINGDYIYVENYQEIIEVIIMQQLMANKMVEFDPIIIDGSPIIETPSGWFLVKRDGNKIDSKKVLDTKVFLGITKDQKAMEEFIHTTIFNNNKDNYFPAFDEVQVRKLLMKSDQAKKLLDLLGREYIDNLSNDFFNNHIRLFKETSISTDKKINSLLLSAIEFGNIDNVSSLLKIGASPSTKNKYGFSALHHALKLGRNDIAQQLIESGANLRDICGHEDNSEEFSINLAVKQNNKEIIATMLAKDPGLLDFIKMKQSSNLLGLAPNNEIYCYLLDVGVSPYSLDKSGYSEFIRQCSTSGSKERLEILLDRGFDPKRGLDNIRDGQNVSHKRYTSVLKYIEDYTKEKEEVFQLMLEKKVITENDLDFIKAFKYALKLGKDDMSRRLIENNDLRVSYKGYGREYAINHAIEESNKELISLMVTKDPGLLYFIKMEQKTNLLELAPNNDMYCYLLDIGVSPYSYIYNINCNFYKGDSEFINQCTSNGNKERLEILLDRGFDPRKGFDNLKEYQDKNRFENNSALEYIKKQSDISKGIFQLMLERNIVTEGDRDFVEFDPAKINYKDPDNNGYPLMHIAIKNGCKIDTLIREGADLNASKASITAMHYAINFNNHHALESLIDAGANYNLANKQGNPPLHHAIKAGSLEAINILLKIVDPNLKNEKGQTALEYVDSLKQTRKVKEIKKIIEAKIVEKESIKMEVDATPLADAAPSVAVASSTDSSNSWQEKVKKREASPAEIEPAVKRVRANSFVERLKEGKDVEGHKR